MLYHVLSSACFTFSLLPILLASFFFFWLMNQKTHNCPPLLVSKLSIILMFWVWKHPLNLHDHFWYLGWFCEHFKCYDFLTPQGMWRSHNESQNLVKKAPPPVQLSPILLWIVLSLEKDNLIKKKKTQSFLKMT